MGNKAWTLKLDWAGKEGFNNAPDKDWQASATSLIHLSALV
jgi:carboxypeptidase C (cathepsin A)